ncbi:histidine phosphatase superfamily [Aspergillus californicus]
MSDISSLETSTSELAAAVKTFGSHASNTQPLTAPNEYHRARQCLLAAIAKLQAQVTTPADFLHQLAIHNQLLACLQWLGEFQVLAYIPLNSSVPIKDLADLTGIPETHLLRVLRMTATAGFLQEPQTGHVAHSALSAPFVTRPCYLDAAMFLAGTAAPSALQMATATQRFGPSLRTNETAYNVAFNTSATFASSCEQRSKLQRQLPAFLQYGTGDIDGPVTDLLSRLDQLRRGNISVVEVQHFLPSPSSKANHDDLRQLPSNSRPTTTNITPSTNITIQQRTPTTPQPIPDASIYILHLPSPSPTTTPTSLAARILAELRAHLDILSSNPNAALILTPRLLPDRATVNADVEATARLRDLSLFQLANERDLDLVEFTEMLNSVNDGTGLSQSATMLGLSIALFGLLGVYPAAAQNQTARVWAVFSYTVNGEVYPNVFPRSEALTSYGASQLYNAGSAFRDRYVALHSGDGQSRTRIESLSPYLLHNEDIKVASTPDIAVLASAQAFMQGLYPPLDESFNATFFNQVLADGSATSAPLGGYQYPSIITLGWEDPQSITIAGQTRCPKHAFSNVEYIGSKEFWHTYSESAAFYAHLHDLALSGEFDVIAANYANATFISEFLDYQVVHNESLLHDLSMEDVRRARWLAGKYVFATNGNTSASGVISDGSIRTIAGQGLASAVLNAFETNIQGRGVSDKMTLQFGGYETVVSFASLLQLATTHTPNFYSLPSLGSSVVLELFSFENQSYPTYPDPDQLYVRFSLRNGTDADFVPYPIFGYSPSKTYIPFQDFQSQMQNVTLGSTADWCRRCNSSAVFCSGVANASQARAGRTGGSRKSLIVAGIIGAVIMLVLLAILAILTYYLRNKCPRKPSSGGYRGDSKMSSDTDLAIKNSRCEESGKPPTASARGYDRHGSWEMADLGTPPRLAPQGLGSSLSDVIEEEWQLQSGNAVRVREHV